MVLKYLVTVLLLASFEQTVLSQFRPPSNQKLGRPSSSRGSGLGGGMGMGMGRGLGPGMASTNSRMNSMIQSGLFGGLGSFYLDSDTLQEKPCGGGAHPLATASPSLRLWGFHSLFEPAFACKCKIFTDAFDVGTIDNSPQARLDCMTEYSGHYCCLRT